MNFNQYNRINKYIRGNVIMEQQSGKKVIVLTRNKRLLQALVNSVRQKGLEYESEIISLYDMDHITRMIKSTGNTRFLREAFSDLIKENNGTPFCIIIDYLVDFGLPKDLDPDNMKLLRTFAISSIILANTTNLLYNTTNIVLISSPEYLEQMEAFKLNPHLVFKIAKTQNPGLNKMLDEVLENPEKIKRVFTMNHLLMDETNDYMSAANKLGVLLDKYIQEKQSLLNLKKSKSQTEILTGEYDPAKILFKISDTKIYIEGKIFNIEGNPKFEKYKENIIYLQGYYVQSNVARVNERLEKFILVDYPKIKPLSIDSEINISLGEHTIIDGGITPALNILLSMKLKDFKDINLITSPVNFTKMENSPGFISLRDYIIKK